MIEPILTVLMPVYNAEPFLKDAIESILSQTFTHFKFLIVDDGSTDGSIETIKHYQQLDPRIEALFHNENKGIICTRNELLQRCDTKYGAWMDADDIALPSRLQFQLDFLQTHNDYAVCTCNYELIREKKSATIKLTSDLFTPECMLFFNYVLNPGATFDADFVKRNNIEFRSWLAGASDFLFWVEVVQHKKIKCLDKVLMKYRHHPNQETAAQKHRQLKGCTQICQYQLKALGVEVASDDLYRFLIYPADILQMDYSLLEYSKSLDVTRAVLKCLPTSSLDDKEVRRHLFELSRRHCNRIGIQGMFKLITVFGFVEILKCKKFGLSLLFELVKVSYKRNSWKA